MKKVNLDKKQKEILGDLIRIEVMRVAHKLTPEQREQMFNCDPEIFAQLALHMTFFGMDYYHDHFTLEA